MNTPYAKHEYDTLLQKIIAHMKTTQEWGQFFPGSFSPNIYDESWSASYFPLSEEEQKKYGFYYAPNDEKRANQYESVNNLPKTPEEANNETAKTIFWDEEAGKPFQIIGNDIILCQQLGVALPNSYYIPRLQKNFSWMPYNGTLRKTTCAKSGAPIETGWPGKFDGRILCEAEYITVVQ